MDNKENQARAQHFFRVLFLLLGIAAILIPLLLRPRCPSPIPTPSIVTPTPTVSPTVPTTPATYAAGRITTGVGGLPFGPTVIVPITSTSGTNYVSKNITDTGSGWVVVEPGDYVISVGLNILSILPVGFGPGETIGGSAELLINGVQNGIIAFMQGNSVSVSINTDIFVQDIYGELPITLNAGDLIQLQASSQLSGAGPIQTLRFGSYKIQLLGGV
jgi:hypothetical protein